MFLFLIIVSCIFDASYALPHNDQLVTVTEIVKRNPSLSKLQSLLRQTELGFKLDESRDLTFIAPDNDAIDEMVGGEYLNYEETLEILSNHVVPEVIRIEALPEGIHEFETLGGSVLQFNVSPNEEEVRIAVKNSHSTVESSMESLHEGVEESINGLVYTISKLLIPGDLESTVEEIRNKTEEEKKNIRGHALGVPDHVIATNEIHWAERPVVIAVERDIKYERSSLKESNALGISKTAQNDVGVLY